MKKYNKIIYICLAGLMITAFSSVAQDLPLMPSDPAVVTGTLPNGMSYYLVSNPTSKGMADFALIQKTGFETARSADGHDAVSVARDALASLPRLRSCSPQSFIAGQGAVPGKDGFVKVSENATLYRFDNVVISKGDAVVDSTMLMLMDIADRGTTASDCFLKRWYVPSDQAVIISGDIDPGKLAQRLSIMSMMTPAGVSEERAGYVWQDTEEAVFETSPYSIRNLATVSASWVSPRTPKEYMNTVQPAIYRLFVNELGLIADARLRRQFRLEGIPVADVSYDHIDSIRSLGDENFTVSVTVAPEHADRAVEILAGVMSSIDSGLAEVHEVEVARQRYVASVMERSLEPMKSNSEYVSRCAASFLYNAPLSSEKEVLKFLRSRELDGETELRLFNNVASALLDGRKNLTVECRVGGGMDMDSDHLRHLFESAWNDTETLKSLSCPAPVDSLPVPGPGKRIKVRSSRTEYISGGVMWTFENGFKVAYRRQETGRRMFYSLAMNGGYGSIKDISAGEGAYMSDYLDLCRVSGLSGQDFRLALEKRDISMQSVVNLSNVTVSGSAPESETGLLMGALLALVNERECDQEEFSYYRSCNSLEYEFHRGSVQDRNAAIDSLMCPDYLYSSLKTPEGLTDVFRNKAEAFFEMQSAKMNDGLLVLVGSMEETRLRKIIQAYAGGFRTSERSFPRTVVRYQTVSGSTSYAVKGFSNSVDMAISVRLPLTADNYMASFVTAGILRQKISEAMDGTGVYVRLSHNSTMFPDERFNVMITLEEASEEGFAAGTELAGFEEALSRLDRTVRELGRTEVAAADVAKYKALLKGRLFVRMTDP